MASPGIFLPGVLPGDTGPEPQPRPGEHMGCLLRPYLVPQLTGPIYILIEAQRGYSTCTGTHSKHIKSRFS